MRFLKCVLAGVMVVSVSHTVSAEVASPDDVMKLVDRLPSLVPTEKGCPSFVARGSMPTSSEAYDYEVIWTEKWCRTTLFDADDGTPLVINTLDDAVALDLISGTLLRMPGGRYDVSVVSAFDGNGSLATSVNVNLDGSGATPELIRFDIREAVFEARERSTIETLEDGSVRLTQQVTADRTRIVLFAPPPSRNVSFGQFSAKEERYTSYHELLLDGIDFSDPALAPPDFGKAGFKEPGGNDSPMAFFSALSGMNSFSKLGLIRRGIRGDAEARDTVSKLNIKWDSVSENEKELLPTWLERLHAMNVTLTPPTKPWQTMPPAPVIARKATTQPSP
jgi:hypothetical protein